ncbi:hypothetical protein Syun_019868 [Stephania yunnanensis]|uniref:Uncharacterized protein n=1 Tax=Stephania yunnanensis TaxID=152371 RepID=A0AAP0IXA5_9MAGN
MPLIQPVSVIIQKGPCVLWWWRDIDAVVINLVVYEYQFINHYYSPHVHKDIPLLASSIYIHQSNLHYFNQPNQLTHSLLGSHESDLENFWVLALIISKCTHDHPTLLLLLLLLSLAFLLSAAIPRRATATAIPSLPLLGHLHHFLTFLHPNLPLHRRLSALAHRHQSQRLMSSASAPPTSSSPPAPTPPKISYKALPS